MIERLNNAFFGAVDFFLRDRRLFLTYITVGGISALTEFLLFNAFYSMMKMPLMVSNLSAIGIVVAFSFLSHKRFSFRDRQAFHRQLPWYLFMFGVALALNNALIYLFVAVLGWWAPLSKLLQIGICFLWNFTFSRLVVFRHAPHHH
jgi:putative flippase GtrA